MMGSHDLGSLWAALRNDFRDRIFIPMPQWVNLEGSGDNLEVIPAGRRFPWRERHCHDGDETFPKMERAMMSFSISLVPS
jgi:hypothetical protein